jgi:hypothetical protein
LASKLIRQVHRGQHRKVVRGTLEILVIVGFMVISM